MIHTARVVVLNKTSGVLGWADVDLDVLQDGWTIEAFGAQFLAPALVAAAQNADVPLPRRRPRIVTPGPNAPQ